MNNRFILITLCLCFIMVFTGCGSENVVESTEAIETTAEETIAETEPVSDASQSVGTVLVVYNNLEDAVAGTILSENKVKYTEEECTAEGHYIMRTEEEDDMLVVYVLTMYGCYQFQNGNFVKASGSGVIPAVMTFMEVDGRYTLVSYEEPEDGSGYEDSIKDLFPEDLRETCISTPERIYTKIKNMEMAYAEDYLEDIGRVAEIGDYADFEYVLLTDMEISVSVSNKISENKRLSDYPSWVGDLERVENGIRYMYEMSVNEEDQRILLAKTEYRTNNVVESFEFDSETGDLIEIWSTDPERMKME